MAKPEQRYASRVILNLEDDAGNYVRALQATEFRVRSRTPLKRVNVMAPKPVSQGFTRGTEECDGSFKIPRKLWQDQYDFNAARIAGRTLTLYVVNADGRDFGAGDQVLGVAIEEVGKNASEGGDTDIEVSFQAIEVVPDLSRRAPFGL